MSDTHNRTSSTAVTPLTHHIPNAQLVEIIPLSAQTVLEIGCGSGATGELYLRRNPRARYIGLEISEDYAVIARQHITECYVGDIETIDILTLTGGVAPDCIVFGDVLEHLQDPWSLLKKLKDQLSPNGCIAACVPNTGHWSVITALLSGQWPYADSGLFDRTHLRFFTQQSLRHLFESAGLHVATLKSRIHIVCANTDVVSTLINAAQSFGIQNTKLENELNTFQWLICGTRQAIKPLVVYASLHHPYGGMSDVRVELPLRALQTEPAVQLAEQSTVYPPCDIRPALENDTLILWQRAANTGGNNAEIERIADLGVATVIDYDDDPLHFHTTIDPHHNTYAMAAGTQTSTLELKQYFQSIGANCEVFRNGLFELPEPALPTPRGANGRLVLFFGALNREEDWAPYIDSLNNVLSQQINAIHIEVVHDQAFYNALNTPYKTFTPLCDYATYHERLRHSDIAWLPLNDTQKNRRKSDLKFIEAAAHGVVSLASPVLYSATLEDGVTGLLYRSPAEFEQQLTRLIKDAVLRLRLAANARQYVSQHRMLAYDNARRLEWYRQCASKTPTRSE